MTSTKRTGSGRRGVLVATLGLALGLLLWWSWTAGEEHGARDSATATVPTDPALDPARAVESTDLQDTADAPRADSEREALGPSTTESELPTESFALEDARWIEGRVELPASWPGGELPEIVALAGASQTILEFRLDAARAAALVVEQEQQGSRLAHALQDVVEAIHCNGGLGDDWARRSVGSDGAFRIPVPASAICTWLALDSLWLAADPVWIPIQRTMQPVVVPAILGSHLSVELVLPKRPDARLAWIEGADVDLAVEGNVHYGSAQITSATRVTFGPLGPDSYSVQVGTAQWFETRAQVPSLTPGESTSIPISLPPGGRIDGFIVDSKGGGIGKASVRWAGEDEVGPVVVTADDGSFSLPYVPLHMEIFVVAWDTEGGLGPESSSALRLNSIDEEHSLRIALGDGLPIAGTVRWPDGTGAAADVAVLLSMSEDAGGDVDIKRSFPTDSRGRFETRVPTTTYYIGLEARTTEGALGFAFAEVEPGARGIELNLRPAIYALSGRLVDDVDQPVANGVVRIARRRDTPGPLNRVVSTDEDGNFAVSDLVAGEYGVLCSAPGHLIANQDLTINPGDPPDLPRLQLTIVRSAHVFGRVLDEQGSPTVGVRLECIAESPGAIPVDFASTEGLWKGGPRPSTSSGSEGKYTISVQPGAFRILVSAKDRVPFEVPIRLVAGERHEQDIVFPQGVYITGEVFDSSGNPCQRYIHCTDTPLRRAALRTESDVAGGFRLGPLPPGTYLVGSLPKDSASQSPAEQLAETKVTKVEVGTEDVHIRIGEPNDLQVRVLGLLLQAGRPVGEQTLVTLSADSGYEGLRLTQTDESGRFEIVLDKPGPTMFFAVDGMDTASWNILIPETAVYEVTLEAPTGSIVADIVDSTGSPVPKCVATIIPSGIENRIIIPDEQYLNEVLKHKGRFRIEGLTPGSYALWVSQDQEVACLEVVVEDGRESMVRLETQPFEECRGRVYGPDGTGALAMVHVAGVDGPLSLESETDSDGTFTLQLPPGEYSLAAWTAESASEPSSVSIPAPGEVALTLQSATIVQVRSVEASGAEHPIWLRVHDIEGRNWLVLAEPGEQESALVHAVPRSSHSIGPLPPGRYRFTPMTSRVAPSRRPSASRANRRATCGCVSGTELGLSVRPPGRSRSKARRGARPSGAPLGC